MSSLALLSGKSPDVNSVKLEFQSVCLLQHLALIHADQPGAEALDGEASRSINAQTIAAYVQNHIWTHTANNQRFRRFLNGSRLLASTTVGSHPKLVAWYHTQSDVLFQQPRSFVKEDKDSGDWVRRDKEWNRIHQNYTDLMADSQVRCA